VKESPSAHVAAAVRAGGLRIEYPGGVVGLHGVDVELAPGEISVVAGPNGSGKTSLLRALAGRLLPSAGRLRVLGADPAAAPADFRRRVAFVPQDLALDPEMTGRELLGLFGALHGLSRSATERRARELCAELGLAEHAGRRVEAWSGGLRRRLHLGLGMLHEPELLLLDEPMAGIDAAGREVAWRGLEARARRGASVVLVTHELREAERHARRVIVLRAGRVAFQGAPGDAVRAYGRRVLELTMATPPADPDDLARRALAVDGVERATLAGDELCLTLADGDDALERALGWRASAGLATRAYRVHEPDLESACATLAAGATA
jgi:ABC-2 type transport system ATP-binding protein